MSGQSLRVNPDIAIAPNDIDAVHDLVKSLQASLHLVLMGDDVARQESMIKARTLIQALETPQETMIKHCWAQTGVLAALNFGVDTGLWKLMAKHSNGTCKVDELAAEIQVDSELLTRLLRHLSAMGYVKETGLNSYEPTNFTRAMALDVIGDGYIAMTSGTGAAPLRFHEYSRMRGHKNPDNAKDTALMYAYQTDKDMFAWQQSLGYGDHFNHHMGGYHLGRQAWMTESFFPVQERLIKGADTNPNSPFLVDIGGSFGYDLMDFRKHHPAHPGRLILQDLPAVINQIKSLDQSIEKMEHNFFHKQPVTGARTYYIHHCLHDWPDYDCQIVLTKIKEAMKPGYSTLLIHEHILPETNARWELSALDIIMLTLLSSKERTRTDWINLIERQEGLKVVKIWNPDQGGESLIEVKLC